MSLPGLPPLKTKLTPDPVKVEAPAAPPAAEPVKPTVEAPVVEAQPVEVATEPASTAAPAVRPVVRDLPGLAPIKTRITDKPSAAPTISTSTARRTVYDTARRAREQGQSIDTAQVITTAAASLGVAPKTHAAYMRGSPATAETVGSCAILHTERLLRLWPPRPDTVARERVWRVKCCFHRLVLQMLVFLRSSSS